MELTIKLTLPDSFEAYYADNEAIVKSIIEDECVKWEIVEEKAKIKPLELRKQQFKVDVLKHSSYSENMLDEFIDYWSEHNDNGKKMLFEMQKTFNIKLRLKTWHKRSAQYQTKSNGVNQAWQ